MQRDWSPSLFVHSNTECGCDFNVDFLFLVGCNKVWKKQRAAVKFRFF